MQLSFQAERDPKINSFMFSVTGQVMVHSSVREGLIVDNDLAQVPEVMPYFFKMAGQLRDDIYEHHRKINKPLQFPIFSDCFCYCCAKGAESAFLWNASDNGEIVFNYDTTAAISGMPTPDDDISDEFVVHIGSAMEMMANVFVDFQNEVWLSPKYDFAGKGRLTADVVACGLYWSSAIGLDFGMNLLGLR
jgi:hypothetical protein